MTIFGRIAIASSRLSLLLAVICPMAFLPAAQAFRLVPIRMEFEPAGRGASKAFRVENESTNAVAVQISMLTRQMDLDGMETNAPADDDFVVYPPQILLKPGQIQTVRVRWVGTPVLETEVAYRILAEELPVNRERVKPAGSGINVLVRYLGSVYIVPKGAKADPVLESAVPRTDASGQRRVELVFNNRGKAHVILRDLHLMLQVGDKSLELGPEELPRIAGENLLAGQRRRFSLPWPAGLPDGPLQARAEFGKRP